MTHRTYISKEEKSMPGFKLAKDRLTLLLGGKTAEDALLVYHSETQRALRNRTMASLSVAWKNNIKAWVTPAVSRLILSPFHPRGGKVLPG